MLRRQGESWRQVPQPPEGSAVTAGSIQGVCMRTCMPFSPRHPAGTHLQGVQEPVALQHRHCGGSACCNHVSVAAGGKIQVGQHSESIGAPPCILLR